MTMHWAILSMGSNLGDPLRNCCQAMTLLEANSQVHLTQRSPFYWTEPVDYTDQQWFLNAALKVETVLAPQDLLSALQRIQTILGRNREGVRFGPRVMDLDIIFYEDKVLKTRQLEIPHPRMHKRRFVLQPICDIDPEVQHPVLKHNVSQLLNQLDKDTQQIKPCYCDC